MRAANAMAIEALLQRSDLTEEEEQRLIELLNYKDYLQVPVLPKYL
jgi:hypothetical protein